MLKHKVRWKQKTNTLDLNKTHKHKEKNPREGTIIETHLFVHPGKPLKMLKWNPYYIHRGPGAELFLPCACCHSLCEVLRTLIMI